MEKLNFDVMHELKNQFYIEFSNLCHRYLKKVPEYYQDEFKMQLGELTSIYGIKED